MPLALSLITIPSKPLFGTSGLYSEPKSIFTGAPSLLSGPSVLPVRAPKPLKLSTPEAWLKTLPSGSVMVAFMSQFAPSGVFGSSRSKFIVSVFSKPLAP